MSMFAQAQTLKEFTGRRCIDVLDWNQHVTVDPRTTADSAYIEIRTPYNRYRMAIGTAYAELPRGAPQACKTLGWVLFDDDAVNKHVIGPKSDATFLEIEKHLHVRELTDALASARRELAEASPKTERDARVKLAALAEKAGKWGIEITVPEAPSIDVAASAVESITPPVAAAVPAPAPAKPPAISHVGDDLDLRPFVGAPVMYVCNPGEYISGMPELPAMLASIHSPRDGRFGDGSDDRASLWVVIADSELVHRPNLPRRGSDAGNGRVHQYNCWDFNPAYVRDQRRLRDLEEQVAKLAETLSVLDEAVAERRRWKAHRARNGVAEAETAAAVADSVSAGSSIEQPALVA